MQLWTSATASRSARVLSRSRLANPVAGPNVGFFRVPFPARAAEDCRTPGPFGVHRLGDSREPASFPRRLRGRARQRRGVRESSRALDSRTPLRDQASCSFASRCQRERQRTAALRDRSESIGLGSPGNPPRSLGGYVGERGSVVECARPLALSTRESRAGPNVGFFRVPFPARAAEDCRTPGPFGVHRLGGVQRQLFFPADGN